MSDIMQPLRGVKVVDLTLAGSGPSCTKVLSEAGASVIWVESTRGTTTRSVHKYDFYCAGKQAVGPGNRFPQHKGRGKGFKLRIPGEEGSFRHFASPFSAAGTSAKGTYCERASDKSIPSSALTEKVCPATV